MWPIRFELDPGESRRIPTPHGNRELRLLDVQEHTWADYYCDNPSHQTYAWASVTVEVDGTRAVLLHRPYQMPAEVNGLRLYVETTRNWATNCQLEALHNAEKTVRFSALAEEEDWGPQDLVFPVANFRWRSSPYNNTWSGLVPYNLLYYHRGEDFGAIPDRLDVLAVRSGIVVQSPLSRPSSSNGITIQCEDGMAFSYFHMNLESIRPDLLNGTRVRAGEAIAKTGETWDGRKCQDLDPHLHVEFEQLSPGSTHPEGRENLFSPYPFLVAAYLRQYPDRVLAQAGGHSYALPGNSLQLDGSGSIARPGEEILSCTWHLSDGRVLPGPRIEVSYPMPGLYAEELRVTAASGAEDRDYALVRVYDPEAAALGWGFCYHTPTRAIRPETEVLFWNRLSANVSGPVRIDFGDGQFEQDAGREIRHAYRLPGIYTSTLSALGPRGEPLTLKMRIVVEEK